MKELKSKEDCVVLTKDQKKSLELFCEWLKAPYSFKPFLVEGFAGSGKTYLSMKLLKKVDELDLSWTVVAPTHKAVGVLRQGLRNESIQPTLYPSTIHRLLRLKLKRKAEVEICEKTDQTESSLENLGLVLIDEVSMIDSKLLEITLECARYNSTRLVFVGDPAQLPPVGESSSSVFLMKRAVKTELREVVRHQGPVLKLATIIRDGQIPCKQPPILPVINSKKGKVGILERTSWLEKAKSALRLSSLDDDHDGARILCYTNRIVDNLVPHARRAIHGEMADQYQVLPGEVLISRKAVMVNASLNEDELGEEPDILISSNREMMVEDVIPNSFELASLGIHQDFENPLPVIETQIAKVRCDKKEFSLRLMPQIGSKSRIDLDLSLNKLSNLARDRGKKNSAKIWKLFFFIRDSFAYLGPASVLTIHRSQGSTFGEVFITSDVFWPKDLEFRRRLVYVAVSRASKGVWIVGDNTSKTNQSLLEKLLID
ncbi:ATP-dependent DNA helicase [Prochlorococcus marinus]|uniref:ATP-dependent DNA helicase n=1 Tax=Prochlorococcus marinus TaxID=1219 RepID=UPI0022B44036|nr:ATP-dependent helicase [Prochlorococcus marinus]